MEVRPEGHLKVSPFDDFREAERVAKRCNTVGDFSYYVKEEKYEKRDCRGVFS